MEVFSVRWEPVVSSRMKKFKGTGEEVDVVENWIGGFWTQDRRIATDLAYSHLSICWKRNLQLIQLAVRSRIARVGGWISMSYCLYHIWTVKDTLVRVFNWDSWNSNYSYNRRGFKGDIWRHVCGMIISLIFCSDGRDNDDLGWAKW
jgi:hypothetical protein